MVQMVALDMVNQMWPIAGLAVAVVVLDSVDYSCSNRKLVVYRLNDAVADERVCLV